MPIHTAAFSASVPTGTTVYTALTPLADNVLATAGTNGYLVPAGLRVIAAWAGSTTFRRARLVAPSLLRVSYPFIRPATAGTKPGDDPNLQVLFDHPLILKDNEVLGVEAIQGAAGAETVRVVLWLADGIEPAPAGSSFWVPYSSSTDCAADKWTQIVVNMEQLPEGTYAVVGFEHWSANAVAARLIFANKPFRPGTPALSGGTTPAAARTHASMYDGRFGVLGTFPAFTPPGIEVLSTSTDNLHEGYLRLVKL